MPAFALEWPRRVPLRMADMLTGVLPAESWIRINRIVTLNAGLVVKTIGRVSDQALTAAIERFCAYIRYSGPG